MIAQLSVRSTDDDNDVNDGAYVDADDDLAVVLARTTIRMRPTTMI